MRSIQVLKKENKYILTVLEKLQGISMNAHETRQLQERELQNCLEFIQQYMIDYQYVKLEHILYPEVKKYIGIQIEPFIEELIKNHQLEKAYFEQLTEAFEQYQQGKFLAIFNIIHNAKSYQLTAYKAIKREEVFYNYLLNTLSNKQMKKIDSQIAYFHKQVGESITG